MPTASPRLTPRLYRRAQNRRKAAWTLAAMALAVALMTWHDAQAPRDRIWLLGSEDYLVAPESDLLSLPEDNGGLTFDLGDIGPSGLFVHQQHHAPKNYPQRQIDLLFRIKAWPQETHALIDTIRSATWQWQRAGNMINHLIFDIRQIEDGTATVEDLVRFIEDLRDAQNTSYSYLLLFDPLAAEGLVTTSVPTLRHRLLATTGGLMIALPEEEEPARQALAATENLKMPFSAIFPLGADPDTFMREESRAAKYFRRFLHILPSQTAQAYQLQETSE